MEKYQVGDLVYHSGLGAGTITGIQTMEISGVSQSYYIMDLVGEDTLMIPVGAPAEKRLHTLLTSDAISEVLQTEPQELDDDFRARQREIEEKIQSGDQAKSAEVLRDLYWRDFNGHLTGSDRKLFNVVKKRLGMILSVQNHLTDQDTTNLIESVLKKISQDWKKADN